MESGEDSANMKRKIHLRVSVSRTAVDVEKARALILEDPGQTSLSAGFADCSETADCDCSLREATRLPAGRRTCSLDPFSPKLAAR